jgi:general stress protein 26
MTTDLNLQFIRAKIKQLRTAVMYSMSNSVLRLPNGVVSAIQVDDEGQLWFISRGPLPEVKEFEQTFPARLCFYKKGVDFHIEVSGKATVMNSQYSPEGDDTFEGEEPKVLLIKMSMLNIEYTEPHTKRAKSKVESWLEHGYRWFLRNAAVQRSSESVLAKLHQTNYN